MYAVVGCGVCGMLWVVGGTPETTGCPRCGTRHRYDRLRELATADDEDEARQARAALIADRQSGDDGLAELDAIRRRRTRLDDAGVPDDEYLEGLGLDPDAIEAAVQRTSGGHGATRSRRETVLAALEALDEPTESTIVAYATDRNVPAESARRVLEKLVREGTVTRTDGRYRRL